MIERIDGIGGLHPVKGPQREKVEKSSGKIEERKEVQISGKAAELLEKAREVPEIREKLVQELREALEKGMYRIDVDSIARKMMEGG